MQIEELLVRVEIWILVRFSCRKRWDNEFIESYLRFFSDDGQLTVNVGLKYDIVLCTVNTPLLLLQLFAPFKFSIR